MIFCTFYHFRSTNKNSNQNNKIQLIFNTNQFKTIVKSIIIIHSKADLQIQKHIYKLVTQQLRIIKKQMASKQAKYKAESIKLSAMLEKTLQEIQIYNLREKQHFKEKQILNEQIDIQSNEIMILKSQMQAFKSNSPFNFVQMGQMRQSPKATIQQRQANIKKVQKLHSYHGKTQQMLTQLQKVLISNVNILTSQGLSQIPISKIQKKLAKYHNNYLSIQEELLKYTESHESLKVELTKMFDENRLLVEQVSRGRNKEKRSKSRSFDRMGESMVQAENMKLKERISNLEREIDKIYKETKSSRLSPFEQRLRANNNQDTNVNKKLIGSRVSSKSKQKSQHKSAFQDQDHILTNPLDDISSINKPNLSQFIKQNKEKEEHINKLKQKIQKLEIENRTIKNIHQQTMRKIQLQSFNKHHQEMNEGDDQEGSQPQQEQYSQHINSKGDSTHCPHRNSFTQNHRRNSISQQKRDSISQQKRNSISQQKRNSISQQKRDSISQQKRKKPQLSQIQKEKKVWAKKYQKLFDQIRLLNKQILLHEQNQKQAQQQLIQTTERLQAQLQKLKRFQQEKAQLNGQIQLLSKTIKNKQHIIEQQKQTINRKTQQCQWLNQQMTTKENTTQEMKSNLREEISSLKNQIHQKNDYIHQLQHQAQSYQHHLTQVQTKKQNIIQEKQHLTNKTTSLINQLSQSHKHILQHQNNIFQLTLTINQLKTTQEQLNQQLTDSKEKNMVFIKGLQQQKLQLQQYITQIKQQSDKLVVRYHQAELTINTLEDTINTVKKQLNQLTNTWGVDNIHLLLTNFKTHYKQTTANLKAVKQLNQQLSQKSSQLQRLLEKSHNRDTFTQDKFKEQVQTQRNNQKVNLDMWKLKFSQHLPDLITKRKNKVTTYDNLLSIIEQHFTVHIPQEYIGDNLSNHLQYNKQLRQGSPQLSPKTSRAKDSDTLSQKSGSKKLTNKKQPLFTYSSKQYKQLETQIYELKLENKNLQDQLQIKTNQLQNLNLQLFKHQTKCQELQEDYHKILAYGKEKQKQALIANSHVQKRIQEGILLKEKQFHLLMSQKQQYYQQQITDLNRQFQSKINQQIRNHEQAILTLKNQHSYQIYGLNHQKSTLNQQIDTLKLKLTSTQTHYDQLITQLKIKHQEEEQKTNNKVQKLETDWQSKLQQQKQHYQQLITKITTQNQQQISLISSLNEQQKSQALRKVQLSMRQKDEQIRVMSESIRIKHEQILIKNSQIQLKNSLIQQKQQQANKKTDSIRQLENVVNQKQQALSLLEQKLRNHDQQSLQSLSIKNQEVQQILNKLNYLKVQYQQQLQSVNSQNQLKLQSLNQKINYLQKANYRLEQANCSLEQLNHGLQEVNHNLSLQNANISLSKTHIENHQNAELLSLQQRISQLQLVIQSKDEQINLLEKNTLQQKKQIEQLNSKFSKAISQLNELKGLKNEFQNKEKQQQSKQSEMELKLWELTMYKQKFLTTKTQNEHLESQVQNLQSQIDTLSQHLSTAHKQNSSFEVQLLTAHNQLSLVKKNHAETSKISEQPCQLQQQKSQNDSEDNDHEWLMGKKVNQPNNLKQQAQNNTDALNKAIQSLKTQLESQKDINKNLSNHTLQLQQQVEQKQIHINTLQKQVQSLKLANTNLQEEYQILSQQMDKIKIENKKLKTEIKKQRQTEKTSRLKQRETLQSILTQRQGEKLTLSTHVQKLSDCLQMIDQLTKQNQQLKATIYKLKESLSFSHSSNTQTHKNYLSEKNMEIQNPKTQINQQRNIALSNLNSGQSKPIKKTDNFNITESYRTIILTDSSSNNTNSGNNPQPNQNRLSSAGLLNRKANLFNTQTQDKQSKTIKRLKDQNLSYLQEIEYLKKYNNDLKLKNQQLYQKLLNKNNKDPSENNRSRQFLSSENNHTSIDDLQTNKVEANIINSPRRKNFDNLNIFNSQPDKLQKGSYHQLKRQQNFKEDNWMMLKKSSAQERQSLLKITIHKLTQDNNKMKQLILHYEEENQLTQDKYQLTLKRQAEIQERYNQIQAINIIVTEKLQEMKSMYTQAKTHADSLEVEKSQLISENLKLSSELSSLKTIYQEDQQGLAEKSQRIASLQEKLQKIQRQLTVTKQEKIILRKEKSDLIKSLQTKNNPSKQTQSTELLNKISKLQLQLKESNQIRQMYYNELKSVENQKANTKSTTLPLLNKIQEMSQTIANLQKQLMEKQLFISQNKQQISELRRFIDQNRSQVSSIIEQNINTKAKIRQVQLMLSQRQTKDVQSYNKILLQKQIQIDSLTKKIKFLQKQYQKPYDSSSSLKQSDSNLKKQFGQKCKLCNRVFNNQIAITIHPVKTRKNSNEFQKQLLWEIQTLKLKVQKLQAENVQLRQALIDNERSVVRLSVEESVHSNMYDTPVVIVEEQRFLVNSEQSKDQKASGKSNSSGKSGQMRQLKVTQISQLLIYSNNNKLIDQNKPQDRLQKEKPLRIIQSQSKNQDQLQPNPTILHPKTSVIDTLTHKLIKSEKIISLFKTQNLQLNHQIQLQKHKIQLLEKQLKSKIQQVIKMKRAIEQISQEIEFQKKRNKNFQQLYDKYRASVKKPSTSGTSSKIQHPFTKPSTLQGVVKKKEENLQKSQPSCAKTIDKNLIESKTKLTVINEESVGSSSIKQPKQIHSPKKLLSKTQLPLQKNHKPVVKHKITSPTQKGKTDSVLQRQSSDEKFREKKSPRNKQTSSK